MAEEAANRSRLFEQARMQEQEKRDSLARSDSKNYTLIYVLAGVIFLVEMIIYGFVVSNASNDGALDVCGIDGRNNGSYPCVSGGCLMKPGIDYNEDDLSTLVCP